jgi:hypothetical protein
MENRPSEASSRGMCRRWLCLEAKKRPCLQPSGAPYFALGNAKTMHPAGWGRQAATTDLSVWCKFPLSPVSVLAIGIEHALVVPMDRPQRRRACKEHGIVLLGSAREVVCRFSAGHGASGKYQGTAFRIHPLLQRESRGDRAIPNGTPSQSRGSPTKAPR